MKNEHSELLKRIMSGDANGETVWACDARAGKPLNKPIRNIKPAKCIVVVGDHRTRYSKSQLCKLGKNGRPTKSIINIFDNTGFKTYSGIPLQVFDNKQDCENKYKEMIWVAAEEMKRCLETYSKQVQIFAHTGAWK